MKRSQNEQKLGRECLAVATLLSVTLGVSGAYGGQDLAAKMTAQFDMFRDALSGPNDRQSTVQATLRRARTWVEAKTKDWCLVVDICGNRTFRPAEAASQIHVSKKYLVTSNHEKIPLEEAIRNELVQQARKLALSLAGLTPDEKMRVYVKREIILLGVPARRELDRYGGRYSVRLFTKDWSAFHVMFAPDGRPIRIDTNINDAPAQALVDALANDVPDPAIASYQENRGMLYVGTFFAPGELRFEVRAYSFHGEQFLNLSQRENPFKMVKYDGWKTYPPDIESYRRSDEYHHMCWNLWNEYGRTGAVRGNWLPELNRFEHEDVKIRYHKSFADYPIVGGEPTKRVDIVRQDGKKYNVPTAEAALLEKEFYDDLEGCHIAHFNMHGGHVGTRYRFARNPGIWIKFQPVRPLGSGNLRHLLIEGCGSMTYLEEPNKCVIFDTWLAKVMAGGINTICGTDGGRGGWTSAGWRFYGRYNKGDSISDAWAARSFDENSRTNHPVTIAYARTRTSALRTLFDGRFTRRRASQRWVAVSVWTTPPKTTNVTSSSRSTEARDKKSLPRQVDLRPQLNAWGLMPRSQGSRPTCSIFTGAGALEFAVSKHLKKGTWLSVEYLDWAGNQVSRVRDSKNFKDLLKGFEQYGVCLEADMPYRPSFDPQLKPSDVAMERAKQILSVGLRIHWITPPTPREAQVPAFKEVLAQGYPVAAGSKHSRLLVGYCDDPTAPGGGIFLTKDSKHGYSQVTYEFVTTQVGDSFWVEPPRRPTSPKRQQGPEP